jgi:putative hydrolase of the HAD superfamily
MPDALLCQDDPDAGRIIYEMARMPALPRAILFDLDETILSFGRRPLLLLELAEQFADRFAPVLPAEAAHALEAAFVAYWADAARHKIGRFRLAQSREEIVEDAFALLRARAPALTPDFSREFGARFHAYREEQAQCFPGAVATVETLKARGVRLALVTNGTSQMQRAKLARFDLARLFEHVQIEEEAGFGKPEPQAYHHALETLGVAARDTWMVGDNLEWEVAAPQRLGIYAIWHDHLHDGLPPGSPIQPDRIIRTIPELLDGLD